MIKALLRRWLDIPEAPVGQNGGPPADPEPGHNGGPPREVERRLVESAGTTLEEEDRGWRQLSGATNRDLSPMTQDRMRQIALYLWRSNLLANRLIELPLAYLLGEGVVLKATEPADQDLLDAFWDDPINAMDRKLTKRVRDFMLQGEAIWPVFVNAVSGVVRIAYLDPGVVATVVMDPDNSEQPIGIVTKADDRGRKRRYRVIVNGPEDVFTKRTQEIRTGFDDGDTFFFRFNDLCNSSRGTSMLLAAADWVDAYDESMFGELERQAGQRAYMWDVTLKGATKDEVAARAREIRSPSSGSVRVHNDSEEWKTESPDLKAADSAVGARLFRNHILGGLTLPEHWFGGGGDVNRNTASEMGEPTFKVFSMIQRDLKHALEEVAAYVLRQRRGALTGSELAGRSLGRVTAVFPELTARDTTKWAAALQQVAAACVSAMDAGLMTQETAVSIIAQIAGRLGVDIDVEAELLQAWKEADERREADTIVDPASDAEEPAIEPAG